MTINNNFSRHTWQNQLGTLLAKNIPTTTPNQCLSDQEIASLADNSTPADLREKMLQHLASCPSCLEIFQLVNQLLLPEKNDEQSQLNHPSTQPTQQIIPLFPDSHYKKQKSFLKPMALAASLLIAILSIYVFFRSHDFPHSMQEMTTETRDNTGKPMLQPPPAKKEITNQMNFTRKGDNDISREKKKLTATITGNATLPPSPQPPTATQTNEESPEINENNQTPQSSTNQPPHTATTSTNQEIKQTDNEDEKRKYEKSTPHSQSIQTKANSNQKNDQNLPSTRLEDASQQQFTTDNASTGQNQTRTPAPGYRQQIDSLPTQQQPTSENTQIKDKNKNDLYEKEQKEQIILDSQFGQVDAVNFAFRSSRTYMPAGQIQRLFRETLLLSRELKPMVENLRAQATKTGNFQPINSYIKRMSPAVTAEISPHSSHIYPNISYFLSRSEPGSPEHRFFTLARQGFCDDLGTCYNFDSLPHLSISQKTLEQKENFSSQDERQERDERNERNERLKQWKNLYPHLTGVFKEVAVKTMKRLE